MSKKPPSTGLRTAPRPPAPVTAAGGISFTTTPDTLTARLPDGTRIEVPTELTFSELMNLGSLAIAMEGGAPEAQILAAMVDGTILPDRIRELLNPLPARPALTIFRTWLPLALAALEELGEGEASQ